MKRGAIVVLASIMFIPVLATATAYGIGVVMKLPLPGMKNHLIKPNYEDQNRLMEQWKNVRIYIPEKVTPGDATPSPAPTPTPSSTPTDKPNEDGVEEFYAKFDEIDRLTFKEYVEINKDVIANGYNNIFIDKVTINNTPTGIKTTQGDEVLAIDVTNNIVIAAMKVNGENAKLAIVKNKKQLGLSVVDDLKIWDEIGTHAKRENALLAINASGYTWNKTGNFGTLYGLAVRNGDLIRRANSTEAIIGFTKNGDMQLGGPINNIYNGCEYSPPLIKNGNAVYTGNDTKKSAKTAIGQTADGDILMLVVDGDNKSIGATLKDLVTILQKYGAVNAANLSDDICTVMWWNGRTVNRPYGNTAGVKLPTVWVVKSAPKSVNKPTNTKPETTPQTTPAPTTVPSNITPPSL